MGNWRRDSVSAEMTYRTFPGDLVQNFLGYQFNRFRGMTPAARGGAGGQTAYFMRGAMPTTSPAPVLAAAEYGMANESVRFAKGINANADKAMLGIDQQSARPGPDLSQVAARKNLNETAFFFPQLAADPNGVVKMQFTMPEALTQWRFLGFAHDAQCRSGFLDAKAVTAKDLMVQPNPPRFLREGDTLDFTVKVSNQTAARQEGTVQLTFAGAQERRHPL